jgi:Fe-S-cluster containining protein
MEDAPGCVECGVCCFTTLPTAIRVSGDDHARMGDVADAFTVFHGHRCFMRVDEDRGHCAALRVDTDAKRFTCAIYEVRPAICRDLAWNGAACAAERFEKSDRPDVLIERLRQERGK